LIDHVLARRGFDIGMREALGAIVRYVTISLGALVILQAAGIDLTSLNVLVALRANIVETLRPLKLVLRAEEDHG
jgi:small-conductance mechanosensitive channel